MTRTETRLIYLLTTGDAPDSLGVAMWRPTPALSFDHLWHDVRPLGEPMQCVRLILDDWCDGVAPYACKLDGDCYSLTV